jgi:tetratricopeptide (TPR) repeat protein
VSAVLITPGTGYRIRLSLDHRAAADPAAPLEETMTQLRYGRFTAALFALSLLSGPLRPASAAEGITKVKGKVTDQLGKPLAKVPIYFEATDIKKSVGPLKTNKNGEYLIATLDRTVAKKWKVMAKLDGYKVVKLSYELVDSSGEQVDKRDLILGTKQEFPDLPLVLVGDEGRNQVDFMMAKDADFVAATQAEQKKRDAAKGGGTETAAAATPEAGAAAAAPAAGPKISPEAAQALTKARDLANAGNHEQAIEIYKGFLAKDPAGNPNVYFYLGKSLFATNDDAGAEQAFKKGVELQKDMKGAHFYLGNLAMRGDNPAGAAAEYEQELKLTPDSERVLYNLGLAYSKAGDADKAIAALERASAIDPSKPDTYMTMASVYEQRGDAAKAEEMYQKVAAIDPHNAAVLFYNVGVRAWNENRPKEAITAYGKALEVDPTYAQTHRELAKVLMAQQDFGGAAKHFQEYLRLNPTAPDAKEIQESLALLKK